VIAGAAIGVGARAATGLLRASDTAYAG
jgi:hypothetical protein